MVNIRANLCEKEEFCFVTVSSTTEECFSAPENLDFLTSFQKGLVVSFDIKTMYRASNLNNLLNKANLEILTTV